jgi:deoxycytidylate deaminase
MIINSGILRIVFNEDYPDELSKNLIQEAGIKFDQINKYDLEN